VGRRGRECRQGAGGGDREKRMRREREEDKEVIREEAHADNKQQGKKALCNICEV